MAAGRHALPAVLGHAFTPFCIRQQRQTMTTTGQHVSSLTAWEGITIGALLLSIGTYFRRKWLGGLDRGGRHVNLSALLPQAWNLLDARPEQSVIAVVGLLNLLLLAWKHRANLRHPPRLRRRQKAKA